MKPAKTFKPSRAIVLDPINPNGKERSRIFAHANAAQVWERIRRG